MPKFTESMTLEDNQIGEFNYTAVPVDELESAQSTLATLVVDCSGSTTHFRDPMEQAIKAMVEVLQNEPTSDQIVLRVVIFGTDEQELHGFIPINSVDPNDYIGSLKEMGLTALTDALLNSIDSTLDYSKQLKAKKRLNNAEIICITDGMVNSGRYSRADQAFHVKDKIENCVQSESLESISSMLIAVNWNSYKADIQKYNYEAGFTKGIIGVDDATPEAIARVGQYVGQSFSSTSQVLGTGGPSQQLTF